MTKDKVEKRYGTEVRIYRTRRPFCFGFERWGKFTFITIGWWEVEIYYD